MDETLQGLIKSPPELGAAVYNISLVRASGVILHNLPCGGETPYKNPTAYMVSNHGPYLVSPLISGLPIKPGRTSGAMMVEDSGVMLVEASGGVAQYTKKGSHLIMYKIEMLFIYK